MKIIYGPILWFLVLFPGVGFADDNWILWESVWEFPSMSPEEDKEFGPFRSRYANYEKHWSVFDAFSSLPECVQKKDKATEALFKHLKDNPSAFYHRESPGQGILRKRGKVIEKGSVFFQDRIWEYICVPDTMDPRE